ncbi:carbon-nitrogen hydrolase [Candidatus Micrarchaeota archaeon]|nr:carbon-nitrogen hydrolase [Candidatus Micrarchaeota archaeon]
MRKEVTLGLIQMSMTQSASENLEKAIKKIELAAKKDAQIVCLPELFTSPYFPQEEKANVSEYAEKIPGLTSKALSEVAKENFVVLVAGSIFEKSGKKHYNTTMVFDESGKMLGKYRKMHIPHDPNFYEQHYFAQGDIGYKVFKTQYAKLGTLICYDQWFPEAARINALLGAEIIFYPTAIGWSKNIEQTEGNWQEAWEAVQRGHAIANSCVVATVNRVGTENDMICPSGQISRNNNSSMTFWGGSFVYDQFGKLLAHGSVREEIIIAKCNLELSKQVREGWRFFYNRRPETYKKILEKKK